MVVPAQHALQTVPPVLMLPPIAPSALHPISSLTMSAMAIAPMVIISVVTHVSHALQIAPPVLMRHQIAQGALHPISCLIMCAMVTAQTDTI